MILIIFLFIHNCHIALLEHIDLEKQDTNMQFYLFIFSPKALQQLGTAVFSKLKQEWMVALAEDYFPSGIDIRSLLL